MKNIAIITGGNSGVGLEFVRQISDTVDEIWVVGRSQTTIDATCKAFSNVRGHSVDLGKWFLDGGKKNIPLLCDFTEDVNVKWLVHSAGYGKFGSHEDLSDEDENGMIALNDGALVALTRHVLPYMREDSHVVFLASCAGFMPLPDFNVYAASKAFVQSYARGLRAELKKRKITVTAVCPPWMKTPFIERAEQTQGGKRLKNLRGAVSPVRVVKKAIKDARKNKPLSVCGWLAKTMHVGAKVLPKGIMIKIWQGMQK